jgi:hypothetical protein
MSLNSKQAFKAGFLLRCAAEGLDTEQTQERVKLAAEKTSGFPAVAAALARLGMWAPFLAAGAGGIAGHFGGRLLSDLKESSTSGRALEPHIPEEIKAQQHEELLDAYTQHANRARRRAATLREKREEEEAAGPAYF